MSSRDAMTYFMESQEFQLRFGAPDAEGFVNLLYQNLLERDADPIGMEHWRGGLESGAFQRVDVVNGFAYSDEMTARLAADVRDGILFG